MNWRRILHLVRKELIQTRRDKRMMGFIFVAPIMQLFLFGYAVTSDVNHVATAVYDEDRTATSRAFADRFVRSGYFDYDQVITAPGEIDRLLESGRAQFVLHIPRGFTKDLMRNRTARVQTLFDGTDATTARVVNGYATSIIRQYAAERAVTVRAASRVPGVEGRLRVWYNPELKSVNFMVPGVLCTILLFVTTIMTSMAVVKEKELGTLEQIVVTPITPLELMLGKTLPFLLVGLIDLTLVLTVAVLWFQVRLVGSVPLLIALSLLFLLTTLGLGVFISTISHTQQEATLTAFFFLLPSILLSGFVFPIDNMPRAIQWITYAIPLRYYLEIIRALFLKGSGLADLWPQVLALATFGAGILLISAKRFSKRLG